jgi:hypothetical protein
VLDFWPEYIAFDDGCGTWSVTVNGYRLGCLATGCSGECLKLRGRKQRETG